MRGVIEINEQEKYEMEKQSYKKKSKQFAG